MANPTLDEFLSAARVDNPGVSDGQLAGYWLKTYANSKTELPKPEATAGGLIRSFGSSAIDTVGSAFQGGGEVVAAGLRAATGNQDIRAANPLRPVTDAIRGGMSENDKLASQDTFKGDITSPSTIELPKTAGGWAHAIASGFGSLSSMILPGAMAATGARGMIMAGAATGALTTGGAAADDVRQGVQKAMEGQTPEQLAQSVPAYRQARMEGMDDGTARQKVENDAAILATTIAGAAGAVGGAFNAKVLEDVVAKRGLATLLGKVSASRAGQIGIGAGVGVAAEGLQEGLEKVGQNVGENIGMGRPAMENATRDTAGDVIMGGLIGGATGGVAGAVTQRRPEEVQRKQAIQDIATAPNVDAAIEAFTRATAPTPAEPPIEFDRLGALGLINSPQTPAAPADTGEAIPYDYSQRQQMYPALPAPEMPSGRDVLVNDTDPQLTRPEQMGDRETAINYQQAQREQAESDRDLGITPGTRKAIRSRITLDEAGNIIDAPDGDRQFLSLVRREARPHAAAAIEAHSINPTLTEAVLAAPNMGPKAERTVFEAIINGNPADQQTRTLLERYGVPGRLADSNGQGAQPVNPAAPGQQPAGDRGSERGNAEAGQGTGAAAAADNRDQGVAPPVPRPLTVKTDAELRLQAKNTRAPDELKAISDELARRKREAAPAQSTAVAPKGKHPNMVIRQVRDRNGNMLGTVMEPYDGTIEGARKAAEAVTKRMYDEFPDAGNVASRMGATDEAGNPKWAISPNFAYINPVDSLDGRATFGDADAIQQVYGPKVAKDVTPADAPKSLFKPGFDPEAFDRERNERIEASRKAGNVHLDKVPAYVESMRGKRVRYVHDPKVTGTIRTVDNRGNVYIDWADEYSAQKEMASPVKEGKRTVMRSTLGPSDLKDYVVVQEAETPKAKTRAKLDAQKPATAQAAIDAFNTDDAKTGMEIVAKLKLDALKEVGAAIGFSVNFTENATRYRERLAAVADRLTKSAREQTGRERKLFDRLSSLASDWDRMVDHTGAPEGSYDGKWMTHPEARKYLVAELDKLKSDPDYDKVAPMVRKARPRLFDAAETPFPKTEEQPAENREEPAVRTSAQRWEAALAKATEDGGDPDKAQIVVRTMKRLFGRAGESASDVWNRWNSFIGVHDLGRQPAERVLQWFEKSGTEFDFGRDVPDLNIYTETSPDNIRMRLDRFNEDVKKFNRTLELTEARLFDLENLFGEQTPAIKEARDRVQGYSQRIAKDRQYGEDALKRAKDAIVAAEEAKYQPFSAADIKKPTPSSIGLTATTAAWFRARHEGRTVWTNGHIVDFAGGPKGAEKYTSARDYPEASNQPDIAKIMPKQRATISGRPVAFYNDKNKKGEAVNSVGLLFEDGKVVAINRDYFAYFTTSYPGAEFKIGKDYNDTGPMTVERNGQIIGLAMPMKQYEAYFEKVREMASDQPPPTPVAESQAPAPSEPGDRGVAPAQEEGAAEPAPAIFGLSGAQLEAMQGGKLRGAEQFTGVAPTEKQVADRKALVAKRKADEAAAVDKAALDPRIAALRDSGVEAGILLKAEKELQDGDDSLIKDLARIQGIELPVEPKAESVSRETPIAATIKAAKNGDDLISWLAEKSENDAYRAIAARIAPFVKKPEVVIVTNGKEVPGGVPTALNLAKAVFYEHFASGRRAMFFKDESFEENGLSEKTALHELLHAATNERIRVGNLLKNADSELGRAVADLYKLQNALVKEMNRRNDAGTMSEYEKRLEVMLATSDAKELLAWGLTDADFQAMLRSVKVEGQTGWSKFVDAVRRMLGLGKDYGDALSELLTVTDRILAAELPGDGKATVKKVTAKAETSAIQDAGQKIGGARKDKWKERGLNLEDLDAMSESEGAELATKANVWKPDYAQMVADGATPKVAAMLKGIYDSLAAQPKDNTPEGRRRYVTMMQAFRQAYSEAIANPGDKTPEQVLRAAMETMKQRIGVVGADGRRTENAEAKKVLFSVYKGRSDPFVTDWMSSRKAEKLVREGFPEKGEPWKRRFFVRGQGGAGITPRGVELVMEEAAKAGTPLTADQVKAGYYTVSASTGLPKAYLPTKEDAEAAAKTLYEQALKANATEDKTPDRPHLDELKREGLAQRTDRDVTADDFIKEFGFRGVEFGNWAAQDERQRILNMAFDGMHDLAEIMGVPPRAMSLNGTMGMAFGARGGGRFAAHYEPGKLVINMTKLRGSGSLAHEFAHALDHYFGELDRQDAYKTKARGASGWYEQEAYTGEPMDRMEKVDGQWKPVSKMRLPNLRPELAKAFDNVMSALFQDQETKAQMVRGLELQLERTQTMAVNEQDPKLKAVYQRSAQSQRQNLEETRKEPDDKTYPKGQSQYAAEAKKLSGKSESGYWSRPTEMFARAFESWVFDRLTAMGARSDYLVHGVESDRYAGKGYKGNPYPTGEERARINAAFDRLAKTFITREGDNGNVVLASRAGYTAPYRDLDAARFTVKTSKTGMPVYLSRTMALSNAREKDALGVPKGGRALAFDIFDRRMKDANGMARKVGMVLVHQDAAGKFVSLRNIQIDPAYREQGRYHGEGVIAGMLLHNGTTPMEVFNIQSAAKGDEDDALPFWKHIGTTILNNSSDPDVIIEGNISLARYMSAGEKRANYGQSSRDSREQPISRRDEARVGEPNARRDGGDQGRGSRTGRVDAVRAELTDAFGEAGVAALEREGILQITTWDAAPKGLTDQLQSGDHGAYWPSRKTAYIFADNLAPGQAVEVLLHEIGEHYGLEEMLGDRYDKVISQVKTLHKAGNKAIVAAWRHVERNYDLEPGSPVFMQEVIAKAGQSADVRKMAWWQRLIADVKAFLIRIGLKNVSDERDLGILLQASVRKAMRDAGVVSNQASGVMASRLSDQLKGMNKDAGGDLFKGAVELDGAQSIDTLTRAATKAKAAFDAVNDNSPKVEDADKYFALSGAMHDARDRLADAIAAMPGELAMEGKTRDGRLMTLTASAQRAGRWQLTRFDRQGEPWGDTQFESKRQAIGEFLDDVALDTMRLDQPDAPLASRGTIGATWDMLQSAKTPAQARALAMNLFDNPNKFNLWDKTIGTQLTKARKNEYFRAVFDNLQGQQDSTAAYAIEAEAEAADVLARMEGMGEIKSALKSTFTGLKFEKGSILPQGERARDLQAVSKAIFSNIEGEQGVKQKVFTDAELAKDFGLNERQIGLYRQSRAAIDRSLDRYAQSLAVRVAQKFVSTGDLHRAGLDDTVEALTERLQLQRQTLEEQREPEQSVEDMEARLAELEELRDSAPREILRSLQTGPDGETRQEFVGMPDTAAAAALDREIRDLKRAIRSGDGFNPANRELDAKIEALDAALSKLPEIAEQANSLKDKGYAPAMRFGDYAVTATQDGETVFFTMVDTKTQANLLKMRLAREMPGAELRVNAVDRESFKLFGGVDPATVELFARFMEVEENDAFKAYIALATSSRSALKHMLERKGIAGFSDNLPRVMAAFITSNARAAARNIHGFDVNEAMEAAQKKARGDVSEEAAKLVNYMNNPTGDFAKVRGFMFAYFMGGSVSSALVNLTQPLMMTTPYLEQFAGKKIAGIMTRAAKAAATGKVEGAMNAALERAEAEGITDAHEYHQLMQEAEGGGSVATRALMKSWGSMFGAAERFNRRITFLAAFETGQGMTKEELSKRGVGDAYEFAKDAVVETQGIYARHNRPNWARNPVGAVALTFKQFSIAWVEFFMRLPRKQQLMALGLLILMAGIEGLPFAEDLEDLIDTIGQRMGRGTNSKKALRTAATNLLGETGAQFALHGISGLAGMPMDVAGRLGMGNLIPGTKLLNPSVKEKGREVAEIAGPVSGLVQKAGGLADGNIKEAMPKAFADAAKAWEMIQTGEYRDTRGRKVMDVDGMDSLMKMIGFQPRDVAANTRFIGENMRDVDIVKRVEAEIVEQWADGIRNKDVAESQEARERLKRWNAENPDLPIKVKFSQILQRVRAANLSRDERFMKTAPPELRRRMLAEAVQ